MTPTPTCPHDCQLQRLEEAGQPLTSGSKLRGIFLRLLSAGERRIGRYRLQFDTGISPVPPVRAVASDLAGESAATAGGSFAAGDIVEVCSLEEIRATLDPAGNCQGLHFMDGMEQHCGKRFRILKPVKSMFDERKLKMVSLKNVYTLEGIICEGIGMYDREGCDRCCYFFWKGRWLKKVTPARTSA